MAMKLKVCTECSEQKWIANSCSCCKRCRRKNRHAIPPRRKSKAEIESHNIISQAKVGEDGELVLTRRQRKIVNRLKRIQAGRIKSQMIEDKKHAENKSYRDRDELLITLGFRNYAHYLASSVWKKIRKGFLLCNPVCACSQCDKVAKTVHHTIYTIENLRGDSQYGLAALCNGCHYRIEFSDKRKRSFEEAQECFNNMVRSPNYKRRYESNRLEDHVWPTYED